MAKQRELRDAICPKCGHYRTIGSTGTKNGIFCEACEWIGQRKNVKFIKKEK